MSYFFGFGTVVDTLAIILAGIIGSLFGHHLTERHQNSLTMASGVSVLFIGISGAMSGMLKLSNDSLTNGHTLLVVACLALGAFLGELLNIEDKFDDLGHWLKRKTGSQKDNSFVVAFVTATLTVCIGAMAIIGPIQDGMSGNPSILLTKSILDFIIVIVLTTSLGKGAAFSAIPVLLIQGTITLFAKLVEPLMTVTALANISMIGSILIFCVGLNLIWGKKIRVANMLPALLFAVLVAYL
ncbi:DUF554 domain-containing protein [Streptococcus uberis]|uniref:DUF554 domain-containing protein n=1 Tax=Streptococcus uberis TaxID=1349 RepID=UPI001FF11AED|nr:DUF554 domain-containing protein [Streptococcus uberis]MCK1168579.1 DUF554 domain-containing protein [Streptococcus uberis]MCK1186966.1 DUF554 domain-containing protein [Streptococcus uberis]MCK1190690.1 DUF554 domain-containing protein [Streptococcus uberis]MCK1199672.1 DUF554 domain-containing protein [Streptococcus uberis]MCK1205236.1 DUF554 domain-containing protein [Streptococcus uberis]